MKNLMIPRLYCPFDSEINPHVEALKKSSDQWVINFELFSKEGIVKYHSDNYSYFTARFYPRTDYHRLSVANDLITLLFMVDDLIDSPFIQSRLEKETALRKFIERFLVIIKQKEEPGFIDENPIFSALKDVWTRLTAISDAGWLASFVKEIESVFAAAVLEYQNSESKKLPPTETYLEKRRYMGAANITLSLIQPIEKVYLPDFVTLNDKVQELEKAACNAICISNDLFSLSKEQMLGDEHNLPSIIKNEKNITLEEAILLTAEIHDAEVKKFIALSGELPFFDEEINSKLKYYVNILELQMAGNFVWSEFETERYLFVYSDDYKRIKIEN
jgi:hypothetical protein